MKLQIISDMHLEFRDDNYPHITRAAPNIALLGDIGYPFSRVYQRFIRNLSKRFRNVIVIAGNHEYFTHKTRKMSVGQIQEQLQKFAAQYRNVHFLDNGSITIDGVRILGTTLWSSIPYELYNVAKRQMQDYRKIYVDVHRDTDTGILLQPNHTNNWHDVAVAWLTSELSAPGYSDTPTIVLSHHAPYDVGVSAPMYETSPLQCCYATDLSRLFKAPMIAWAHGHTHWKHDHIIKGVRIVSSPMGYPGEIPSEISSVAHPIVVAFDENVDSLPRPFLATSLEFENARESDFE